MYDVNVCVTEEKLKEYREEFLKKFIKRGMGNVLKELYYASCIGLDYPEWLLKPKTLNELQTAMDVMECRYIIDCLARDGYSYAAHYEDEYCWGADYYVITRCWSHSWAIVLSGKNDVCKLKRCNNEELEKYAKRSIDSFAVLAIQLGVNVAYFNQFYSKLS